ncbi:uncharacterized protein LOC143885823 [Tasmannia lanceolata]|uniref:uncharacterized protein LOC143885823 n=1 Tax=Tasmannia lanceolata TaxID=3420 RepID=UPI0040636D6F
MAIDPPPSSSLSNHLLVAPSGYIEGHASNRPPYFNRLNYGYWKIRMTFYLKSVDFKIWELVHDGYIEPTTDRKEWSVADKIKATLDAKEVTLLFCALSLEEFIRVSTCKTAREILTTLETTHEGTTQVKSAKVNMLISDFEAFEMHEGESISNMFIRFTNIVNELNALGKTYTNYEFVQRLLRCFPDS